MRIISKRALTGFWGKYPDSEVALKAWHFEAKNAAWTSPHDVKAKYGSASIVGKNRAVFNICGNKYRLVVQFNYAMQIAYIRFVGTHKDYDKIDVETI